MDCRAFQDTFSDYLDGVLDAADEVCVRRHLSACAPCRRLEAAYRTGVAVLRELDPPCVARDFSVPALSGAYGAAGALLAVTLVGLLALDYRERADPAPALPQFADTAPATATVDEGGLDLITVRMRDGDPWFPPGDPYVAVPASAPDPSYRLRFEVPAVWSGR
jgi:anti-sigma factor RsiW